MTGHPGVFAGGDIVRAERTVTVGVGHGKKAARSIDAWLRDQTPAPERADAPANFEHLNTWYYADAPRAMQPMLELARRRSTFEEVVGGLDETTALFEARRCMSCGDCFQCDNCLAVCPDNAVLKVDDASTGIRDRLRLLQGLWDLRRGMPVRRDRDGPGGRLDAGPRGRSTGKAPIPFAPVVTASWPTARTSPRGAGARRR